MEPVSLQKQLPLSQGNIKILLYFAIGVVVYLVVTGKIRKWRQDDAYGQAGNDANTAHAIQVRQACNPSGISWMIDIDSTWNDDLNLVADQISDVAKVNAAYQKLYNENMFERLEKELTAPEFQEWMRRAQAPPAVTQTTSGLGGKIAAIRDTIVWRDTDSTKVAKRVKAGETIGTKVRGYDITSKGVKKGYWLVSWSSFGLTSQGLVLAADTKAISV